MTHPMRRLFALLLGCVIATAAMGQSNIPTERNAALRYWLAFAEMHDPPADKSISDLLEKTAAGDAPWDEAKLGPIVDENIAAIQMMQRATKLPDCDWGIEYSQGPAASIAPVVKGRVLGRLNAVYGMRLAAKGDMQGAVDTWVAGMRFSRDLARGGSLIFALIGSEAMLSNLHALEHEAQSGKLDAAQKKKIESVAREIPETGFDWGEAMRYEELAVTVGIHQVAEAPDPAAYYQLMMRKPAPADFSAPTSSDIAAVHKYMADEEAALRLPPSETQARIPAIQAEANSVKESLRPMIPGVTRVNDVRIKVQTARRGLLEALGSSANSTR
jgi:hypothetical protein